MRVRALKSYPVGRHGIVQRGQEVNVAPEVAKELVKTGRAEVIDEAEVAVVQPVQNAMRKRATKRQGKPQKKTS